VCTRRAEESEWRMNEAVKRAEAAEEALQRVEREMHGELQESLAHIELADAEKERLENKLAGLTEELDKALAQLSRADSYSRGEKTADKKRIKELEDTVEELTDKVEVHAANLSRVEERCADSDQEHARLQSLLREKNLELSRAEKDVETSGREKLELTAAITALKQRVVAMNDRIVELQGNIRVFCRVRPVRHLNILSSIFAHHVTSHHINVSASQVSLEERSRFGLSDLDIAENLRFPDVNAIELGKSLFEFDRVFSPEKDQVFIFIYTFQYPGKSLW